MVMTCATNRHDFPLDIQDADEERRWLLWDVILCASAACFGAPNEVKLMTDSRFLCSPYSFSSTNFEVAS